jgi:hypothetical protein
MPDNVEPTKDLASLALYFVRRAKSGEIISAMYRRKPEPMILAKVVAKKRGEEYQLCARNIWSKQDTILESY